MKFRTDFVTNSSSSSFCAVHFTNKELAEYLASLGIKCDSDYFENRGSFELPSGKVLDYEVCVMDDDPYGCVSATPDEFGSITGWFMNEVIYSLTNGYPIWLDYAEKLERRNADGEENAESKQALEEFLRLINAVPGVHAEEGKEGSVRYSSWFDRFDQYLEDDFIHVMTGTRGEGDPRDGYIFSTKNGKRRMLKLEEEEVVQKVGAFEDDEIDEQIEDWLDMW